MLNSYRTDFLGIFAKRTPFLLHATSRGVINMTVMRKNDFACFYTVCIAYTWRIASKGTKEDWHGLITILVASYLLHKSNKSNKSNKIFSSEIPQDIQTSALPALIQQIPSGFILRAISTLSQTLEAMVN